MPFSRMPSMAAAMAVTLVAVVAIPATADAGTGQFNGSSALLSANGACTAASPTSWYTPAQFTGSTGDRFGSIDDFVVYLVDDAGKILSTYTDQATVGSTRFFNAPGATDADPGNAPFKLVIFDGGALGTQLAPGANISSAVGTTIAELTFDPGISDPDCPAVDTTAPTVTSLTRQTPATSPTSADSVTWRFTFDEAVQNVTTDDFEIQGTTATVQSVTNTTGHAWDVVVSGGDLAPLNGSIAIGFDAGQNITDLAGNAYVDASPSGAYDYDWTIDNIAPQILSITRPVPATSPTNADSVTWRLTWSEPVTMGAGSGHFIVVGTTATANLETAGSSATQDVTISGGNLAALDGTVTISFSGTPNITDAAGNTATNTVPIGTNDNTYVIDNTAPRMASIERQSPQVSGYTNEDSVIWRVTFDEAVSGVDATDFSRTGTTGTIGVVNNSTVESAVTISGGNLADLDATVTLGVLINGSIVDAAGNSLANSAPSGTNDATFIIDNTPPNVPSTPDLIAASDSGFSSTDDITSDTTPGFGGTVIGGAHNVRVFSSVDGIIGSASGATWSFADSFTTLTPGIHVITAQAFDEAENASVASSGLEVIVDTAGPVSTAFYRAGTSPTSATSASWILYWENSDIRDLDVSDFTIEAAPAVNASVTDVSFDGNTNAWVVTIGGAALANYAGTINLAFDTPGITDTAGNGLAGGNPATREAYVFENTPPTLVSLTRLTPGTSPTSADSVTWRFTFDEAVQNVTADDFKIQGTTAIVQTPSSLAIVQSVTNATEQAWDVAVSGGDLATLSASIAIGFDPGQNITDVAGNAYVDAAPSGAYEYDWTIDNTAPRVASIERLTPTDARTNADSVTWRVTFDEAVSINGNAADGFAIASPAGLTLATTVQSATQIDVQVSGAALADANRLLLLDNPTITSVFSDLAGNLLAHIQPTGVWESFTIDNTPPGITASASPVSVLSGFNLTLAFTSEVTGVEVSDLVVTNATVDSVSFSHNQGDTFYYRASIRPAGLGVVTVRFPADAAVDLAGNGNLASNTVEVTVDDTAPTVQAVDFTTPGGSPTASDTLEWTLTFSEPLSGITENDFLLSGTTATVTSIINPDDPGDPGNPIENVYILTASGGDLAGLTADVVLSRPGSMTDIAGNSLSGFTPSGLDERQITVDNSTPRIASITRQSPAVSPTNADSLTWLVTFDEIVSGVDAADFVLTGSTAGLSVAPVVSDDQAEQSSPDVNGPLVVVAQSVWTVTASGGDLAALNGVATLGLVDGLTIVDLTGNALTSTVPTGANDNAFTLDNTPPSGYAFTIDQNPVNSGNVSSVSVSFAGLEVGTTYTYSLSSSGGGTPLTGSGTVLVADGALPGADATGLADGVITASITLTDAAGNVGAAATDTATKDTVAPSGFTVSIDASAINAGNQTSISVLFDGFTVGGTLAYQITSTGGAGSLPGSLPVPVASGVIPGLDVSIIPDGLVTLEVIHTDPAGNGSAPIYATIQKDTGLPTPQMDVPASALQHPQTGDYYVFGEFTLPIEFDEPVSAFSLAGIAVTNGVASNLIGDTGCSGAASVSGIACGGPEGSPAAASARSYSVLVTPAADGPVTVDIGGGAAVDGAGNPNLAAQTLTLINEEAVPTVAVTGPAGPVNATFTVTATFSEAVADFTVEDLVVGNGAASDFQSVSALVYTATITAQDDGTVTVDIPESSAVDAVGKGNEAAGQFSVRFDQTPPDVLFFGPPVAVNGPFTIHFIFVDDVTGFAADDVTVSNGVLSDFTQLAGCASDGPVSCNSPSGPQSEPVSEYTATITPTAEGLVRIDVRANAVLDLAGNANLAATASTDYDTTGPTVVMSRPATAVESYPGSDLYYVPGRFILPVAFNEDVAGFGLDDVSVTNGTALGFIVAPPDSPESVAPSVSLAQSFAVIITPAGDGLVTVDVAAAAASDRAGNPSSAAAQFTINADITPATVESIVFHNTVSPTDADTVSWIVRFSEFVELDAADMSIAGTTATLDAAVHNFNGGPTSALEHRVTASGGDLASLNGVVTLGFASGATVTNVSGLNVAAFEPTGTNQAAVSIINDADAPTVASIVRTTPSTVLTNADSLTWTVAFSENVTAIDTGDFAVSGVTGIVMNVTPQAVALPPSVTGEDYSAPLAVSSSGFTITASGGDMASYSGEVVLSFAPNQNITDAAGNALTNTTPTGASENSFTLDNIAPTVTLSTAAAAPVSGPFTITATFSEDVTGVEVSDLVVGNGTVSGFLAASASVYTATITPGTGSTITVDVASAAAADAVGNESAAATQFSIVHDTDRTLTVSLPGVGSGTVASAPAGISCGTDCTEDYAIGTSVTLTATADAGSTFAGWRAGPCSQTSTATCAVALTADTTVSARFTLDTPPAGRIVAATLPAARSGYVGGPVISAFLSVVSRTTSPAQSCQVAAPQGAPVTLTYHQLDATGTPTGPDSPLFDILAGGTLNFVIAMTPTAQTSAAGYSFLPVITCENASLDPIVGVNSVFLTIGAAPAPDILSIAATPSNDGVIRIPAPGRVQFMTAAAVNIGVGDGSGAAGEVTLTTTVDTGAAVLPLSLEICQIDSASICITPRGASVTSTMTGNNPLFFAAFVRDTSGGAGIAFDPANARVFLRFADASGTVRSATSAAVTAPAAADIPELAATLPVGRWSVLVRQPEGVWPGLARASLYVSADGTAILDDGRAVRSLNLTLPASAPAEGAGNTPARFEAGSQTGAWTRDGAIRLGAPWAEQIGEFWGVRDTRSDVRTNWSDFAGSFGDSLTLSLDGELRGALDGCIVYGQASGPVTRPATLTISGCADAGTYAAVLDTPANDNAAPALLIAKGDTGWREERRNTR